tara:strand:- start:1024 stop:1464 length:441 start_codon:yes stop_codon:yes gene_type:complete
MLEPLIFSSSLLIGKEMFTQTINTTTKNIYNGIDKVLLNDNIQFRELLDTLDINTKLDIINSFIIDIHKEHQILNNTLNKTLKYLENSLNTIDTEIKNIDKELIDHNNKWFSRIRSSKYPIMLNNLIKHMKILDERFNLLIKLMNV